MTLLRRARLSGATEPLDLLLEGGRIAAIGASGTLTGADPLDLDGRFVLPGFWDAHVHFTQWVIKRQRVDLAPADSAAAAVAIMREALAVRTDEVLVGYGFRDGLWPDAPTLAALDAIAPDRPVVLISGDLHCGWLNTAAGRRLGVPVPEDGMLRETEWIGMLDRLDAVGRPPVSAYREAADAAAARGVVGIVEFENTDNLVDWPARVSAGVTALRVEAAVWPDRLDAAIAEGLRTGDALDSAGLVRMGRLKIVVDGSLNTRTAYCWDPYPGVAAENPHPCGVLSVAPEDVEELLVRARDAGISPAVHAIGDRANTAVLDVFERLGIAGTIEHAQLVAREDFERFGRLGLVASVQPEHAMDDRDVADRYWPGRTDRSFAFGSLHAAGATLALGSDAPVAPLDPWISMSAAVSRRRDGREAWHPAERLPFDVALAASTRGVTVGVGAVADLVVLDADPSTSSSEELRGTPVAATLLGGRLTHSTL
ncbi:amidohydrolase family protein [Rathayibacter sp. VKM Ac-2803]|uniref:amidohydrolase n=1 Tax=Rathayibacter sp. VKM Ac-2803 TaxID=2609256 RepID=UPI00135A3E68|nr:amidohydrolase [Rathayibacter sp. VKM Ac-2803]MWV48949.1 amidohydrolase family protein [Rathayibacter sp. VKM Ac-2803]